MAMDPKHKILIVDDEENIRWVFKKALGKKDFLVDTAVIFDELHPPQGVAYR